MYKSTMVASKSEIEAILNQTRNTRNTRNTGMLYTQVSRSQFSDMFYKMNREDNFSYDGLTALYDYLSDYAENYLEGLEIDVISLCCNFTEYENLKEFQDNYGTDYQSIEDIEYQTMVIRVSEESFIIQDF